jgi:hypothetical protein
MPNERSGKGYYALAVAVALFLAAVLTLITFGSFPEIQNAFPFDADGFDPRASPTFTITGFDHATGTVSVKVAASAPPTFETIPIEVMITSVGYPGRPWRTATLRQRRMQIRLNLEPADASVVTESPLDPTAQAARRRFEGSVQLPVYVDLRWFPYEDILLGLAIRRLDVDIPGNPPTDQAIYWVENRIKDYHMAPAAWLDHDSRLPQDVSGMTQIRHFVLERPQALRSLAVVLFLLAFIGGFTLMFKKDAEVPLLAYFVALWGARGILMGQLEGSKPFPTLVDAALIFLFGAALVSVIVVKLLRSKPPEDADPGSANPSTFLVRVRSFMHLRSPGPS